MSQAPVLIFAAVMALIMASRADALCSGASVSQEFREADLVIRTRLNSEVNIWSDEPSKAYQAKWGDGGPVVLYGLHVEKVYKGSPRPAVRFFEERNIGAFYLDPDKDYLLFLNRRVPDQSQPLAARGAFYVRYACGQSKLWSQVQLRDLTELGKLSGRK